MYCFGDHGYLLMRHGFYLGFSGPMIEVLLVTPAKPYSREIYLYIPAKSTFLWCKQ